MDAGAQLGEGDPLYSTFPLLFSEQLLTRNSCQVLKKNKNASCVETKPGFAGMALCMLALEHSHWGFDCVNKLCARKEMRVLSL